MNNKVIILTGRSGVGKGTQSQLFLDYLKGKYPKQRVVYFEAGGNFRKFIARPEYTSQLTKEEIYDKGELFPEFLAVYNWANFFIENIKGNELLVIDGSPRKLREAIMLDEAFEFYEKEDVRVIFLDASQEWSEKLLLARGRSDDTPENVIHRLDWFEKEVAAIIKHYREHKKYTFLKINAEQTPEAVHEDIVSRIGL